MKKLLLTASVAGLVLFGAVGCSTCCGSKTTAASPCANGQCATTPTTTSHMMTSGMSAQPMPTTMTAMPGGKPPMVPVSSLPAGGAPMPTGGSPALLPQN